LRSTTSPKTRFAELLIELGIRARRMALPGVQDKTRAVMVNLPVARAGERFILKLQPRAPAPGTTCARRYGRV
jgi:hypothetical protein